MALALDGAQFPGRGAARGVRPRRVGGLRTISRLATGASKASVLNAARQRTRPFPCARPFEPRRAPVEPSTHAEPRERPFGAQFTSVSALRLCERLPRHRSHVSPHKHCFLRKARLALVSPRASQLPGEEPKSRGSNSDSSEFPLRAARMSGSARRPRVAMIQGRRE